ncbi:hypothetical protein A3L10_03750 [Thermococcus radiotolerans]|uniref:Uncharacterized protein n=1 Tax=Thermococcus radiotolerans TaxID=187880 RepID=A0A2Z2MY16_9EURY|nr:hypothetical protein A3L10_03750 [Thermococcus radiotolerans]
MKKVLFKALWAERDTGATFRTLYQKGSDRSLLEMRYQKGDKDIYKYLSNSPFNPYHQLGFCFGSFQFGYCPFLADKYIKPDGLWNHVEGA